MPGSETLGNSPALPAQEGQSLRLLCAADSNPPALISWFRGSLPLSPSNSFNSGVLDLPRVELGDHGKYTCRAHHPLGSRESSLTLLVKKPPQLLGPSCSWEDESLHCCCSAQSQLVPSLRWRLREELLDGNLSNASFKITSSSAGPWANSSLSLHEGLGSNLRLSCEAQNAHGKQSGTILLLPTPGAGRPGARSGVVLGALGGVAVTILLALCLCVTFFVVRIYRRKLAEKASNPDSNDPALSPVSKGHLNEPCAGSPSAQGTPRSSRLRLGQGGAPLRHPQVPRAEVTELSGPGGRVLRDPFRALRPRPAPRELAGAWQKCRPETNASGSGSGRLTRPLSQSFSVKASSSLEWLQVAVRESWVQIALDVVSGKSLYLSVPQFPSL